MAGASAYSRMRKGARSGWSWDTRRIALNWAAIESIAATIGCTAGALRRWMREGKPDAGVRPGLTRGRCERCETLEREMRQATRSRICVDVICRGAVRPYVQAVKAFSHEYLGAFTG